MGLSWNLNLSLSGSEACDLLSMPVCIFHFSLVRLSRRGLRHDPRHSHAVSSTGIWETENALSSPGFFSEVSSATGCFPAPSSFTLLWSGERTWGGLAFTSTWGKSPGPCTTGNVHLNICYEYESGRMGPSQGRILRYFLFKKSSCNLNIYFCNMAKNGPLTF